MSSVPRSLGYVVRYHLIDFFFFRFIFTLLSILAYWLVHKRNNVYIGSTCRVDGSSSKKLIYARWLSSDWSSYSTRATFLPVPPLCFESWLLFIRLQGGKEFVYATRRIRKHASISFKISRCYKPNVSSVYLAKAGKQLQ